MALPAIREKRDGRPRGGYTDAYYIRERYYFQCVFCHGGFHHFDGLRIPPHLFLRIRHYFFHRDVSDWRVGAAAGSRGLDQAAVHLRGGEE